MMTAPLPTKTSTIKLSVLFEDEYLLAINKPAWWVVHRGLARDKRVLVDEVKRFLSVDKVFPVHRLDRQTSGVLLFSKNADTARLMQSQFENSSIKKEYIALVRGICPDQGRIDSPVPKNENGERVPAVTDYHRIAQMETTPRATSLVRATPYTGRFHQIRRHLKHINHPIIGDANYGKGQLNRELKKQYGLERMALHALSLQFVHPATQTLQHIEAPFPPDLKEPLLQMGASQTDLL